MVPILAALVALASIALGVLSFSLCVISADSDRQMAARVRENLAA